MRPERRFERRNGTGGCDVAAARTHTDSDPSEANLLRTNIGLDKGVHFIRRFRQHLNLKTAVRSSVSQSACASENLAPEETAERGAQRAFEKFHAGARRLSIRRMA